MFNVCGINIIMYLQNAIPQGVGPFDAAFGEFPWQAMVLKESTKSLLCGGAIIQADTVLTAANCVQEYVLKKLLVYLINHLTHFFVPQ